MNHLRIHRAAILAMAFGASAASAAVTRDPATGIRIECVARDHAVNVSVVSTTYPAPAIAGALSISVDGAIVDKRVIVVPGGVMYSLDVPTTSSVFTACATFEVRSDVSTDPAIYQPARISACALSGPPLRVPLRMQPRGWWR